jgi:hypothetical protein
MYVLYLMYYYISDKGNKKFKERCVSLVEILLFVLHSTLKIVEFNHFLSLSLIQSYVMVLISLYFR